MKKTRNTLTAYLLILALTITATLVTLTRTDAQPPSFSKGTYKVGVGYKVTLKLNGTDGKSVNWKISKKARKYVKVVKMTSKSLILKGKKIGKINVTANVGGRLIRAKVHIKKKYVALSDKRLYLKAGQRTGISITGVRKVSWKSSNKKVCTVYRKSKTEAIIRAKNSGTAYVVAKAGKKTYRCRVKVIGKSGNGSNGNSGKKKDNKKNNKSPLLKYPGSKPGGANIPIKKNTFSVKIQTSLSDKTNAAKVRKLWNIPDSTYMYDTVTITLKNNSKKNICIGHEYNCFGTLYCQHNNYSVTKISKQSFSWCDPKQQYGTLTIKAGGTRTQTYKVKKENMLECFYYNSPYGFVVANANEPVQVYLSDHEHNNNYLYLYFPATGKSLIVDGNKKEYTHYYNYGYYHTYLDFRDYKGTKEKKYLD